MPEITLYRYNIFQNYWDENSLTNELLVAISEALNERPFFGNSNNDSFGFLNCGVYEKIIYGHFIQKFSSLAIDYDSETKEEIQTPFIDSADHYFFADLIKLEIVLQAKRAGEIPSRDVILERFKGSFNLVLDSVLRKTFAGLAEAPEEVDREKIVKIFYEDAQKVIQMEFEEFDSELITEEKRKRNGKRQTYFNPREEFQEAMEEGATNSLRLRKNQL